VGVCYEDIKMGVGEWWCRELFSEVKNTLQYLLNYRKAMTDVDRRIVN